MKRKIVNLGKLMDSRLKTISRNEMIRRNINSSLVRCGDFFIWLDNPPPQTIYPETHTTMVDRRTIDGNKSKVISVVVNSVGPNDGSLKYGHINHDNIFTNKTCTKIFLETKKKLYLSHNLFILTDSQTVTNISNRSIDCVHINVSFRQRVGINNSRNGINQSTQIFRLHIV